MTKVNYVSAHKRFFFFFYDVDSEVHTAGEYPTGLFLTMIFNFILMYQLWNKKHDSILKQISLDSLF